MTDRNPEGLSERERACLAHLEEARRLGVSFSQYCREKELSMNRWTWIKRTLVRKGVMGGGRRAGGPKTTGFVPVRVAPAAAASTTVCRIRHPSGWTIECAGYPATSWMAALMSGEAA
ncbi:MAG TPA: hypothetical protein VIJ65_06635 [Acidobacteriaceae bacterium]